MLPQSHWGPVSRARQWDDIAEVLARRGLIPLLDLAYQGLGEGVDADTAGLRRVVAAVPRSLDRRLVVEIVRPLSRADPARFAVCRVAIRRGCRARSNLVSLARSSYSMPPDYGAAIVRTILGDAELTRQWSDELDDDGAASHPFVGRWRQDCRASGPPPPPLPSRTACSRCLR